MNWLAISPLEAALIWSALAAAAVWLYLRHPRPRPKRVSTLRFWRSIEGSSRPRRKRRIGEPWALLAQVLFLLLIVLALADLRPAGQDFEGRYVALLLDSSAWSQSRPAGQAPWIERIRGEADDFVDRLAFGDHVLIVSADADASPLVSFTADRAAMHKAIAAFRASDTAADLPRALELARAAVAGKRRSAIVYIGPGLLDEPQARRIEQFRRDLQQAPPAFRPQLLVRRVGDWPVENRGITRLALRRDTARPDRWRLLAQVHNYGRRAADTTLTISIDGRVLERQTLRLAAGQGQPAHSEFTWADGGLLEAEISPPDALAADNRALAHLPVFRPVHAAVFTRDPKILKPVFATNPYVVTEFLPPGGRPAAVPQVAIYDAVPPPPDPDTDSIVFLPAGAVADKRRGAAGAAKRAGRGQPAAEMRLTAWNPRHPVTRWLRTRDVSVTAAAPLAIGARDVVLAWSDSVPLLVARQQNGHKQVLAAFDLRQSNLPFQPAFPLLMAAAIEWMTGAVEEMADAGTTGEVRVAGPASRVFAPSGAEISFARAGDQLQLLAFQAGLYRIAGPEGEFKLAVNLPPLPAQRWLATSDESSELQAAPPISPARRLWPLFVLLALVPLWAEWHFAEKLRVKSYELATPPSSPPTHNS
ncbi:MAG: VWA domain-containing protein [Acidobacteria bacterium]|nr:VWA domain-containing protein [Acidobacteriota bacterium]